jgi:hypothetical protein
MRVDSNDLAGLLEHFAAGAEDEVARLFAASPNIDMPETGRSGDAESLARCVETYRDLLKARGAKIAVVNQIDTRIRSVAELSVELRDLQNPLTVAIVGDRSDGCFREIRGYHAMQIYKGYFTPRSQLLAIPEAPPAQPAVLKQYFRAIHEEASLENALSLYSEDAYIVNPLGLRVDGRENVRVVYGVMLSSGGIALHPCTATDDGRNCAIEWACDRWGDKIYRGLEAGCAVYEYEGDRLRAARIYDDLDPPFPV